MYPKSAQNKDNEWLWIVNDNKNLQGVRIEECSSVILFHQFFFRMNNSFYPHSILSFVNICFVF